MGWHQPGRIRPSAHQPLSADLAGAPFPGGQYPNGCNDDDLFVEHHGYFMDQELMAASAGYVRDSFVMASLDQFSEFEHLERILLDAVCDEPIDYSEESLEGSAEISEKYRKYQKEPYLPEPHYRREE